MLKNRLLFYLTVNALTNRCLSWKYTNPGEENRILFILEMGPINKNLTIALSAAKFSKLIPF